MRRLALPIAAGLVLAAAPARAQLPSTIAPDLFAFPGSHDSPGSALSAGRGMADRWLGDEPFDNPAVSGPATLELTPLLYHVNRQDLRADHHGFAETSAFFDAAGGFLRLERGRMGVALYGYQPMFRQEDNSFQTGTLLVPTGTSSTNSQAREFRGGLALSLGRGHARLGIAGEWTHRSDHYESTAQMGGPAPDHSVADFSGDAAGGQAGVRVSFGEGQGSLTLGGAVRYMAELDLTGDETLEGASGSTHNVLSTRREAGWEGGVSARYAATDAFHVLGSVGGSSQQKYQGWDVASGPGFEWKLAGEYHDARDPWTVRLGLGQEQQSNVPEPRAGVVGLGFGYRVDSTTFDIGLVHRTFERADSPNSTEDRLLLSLVQSF